ncbi:MAG: molybdopterin-guanine dinucleotide biosynthesis protein B [Candidatus Thorarchaeota archaeon]|nr:molybdopterin-guanine dinucleotide biosynthesis protein B [Candidatus Thorarchaeota archaeon]
MRVFAISGLSGTGKTTLLERLVRELVRKGYSVATLKSTQEDVSEPEGTDTWKHQRAGAKTTVLLGPQSTTIRHSRRINLRDIFTDSDFDFLLVEGMKQSKIPKCWCLGRNKLELEQLPPETIAAVAWDRPAGTAEIPIIQEGELSTLVDVIEKHAVEFSLLED